MARRRGFGGTALRAALGAVTGVAEGLRNREESAYKKEQDRLAKERQDRLDAQTLAMQLAGLQAQGWQGAEEIAGPQREARQAIGDIASSAMFAASGGVPRQAPSKVGVDALSRGYAAPGRSVTMGGRQMFLRETDDEARERIAQTELQRQKAERDTERARSANLVSAARTGGRKSAAADELLATDPRAYASLFPEQRPADPLDAMRIADYKAEQAQREAEGMAFLSDNANNQAVIRAYGAAFGRNPNMTPGQIGYALMQQVGKAASTEQKAAAAGAANARAKGKPGRIPTANPPGFPGDTTALSPKPAPLDSTYSDLNAAFNKRK